MDVIIWCLQIPEDTKDIKVGTLIGLLVAEGENWREVEIPASSAPDVSKTAVESDTTAAKPHTGASHTE
jgi:pyruvate/2-oxoglutarate dehydrogenase complex dihydrolipoamide acyltransferase (E2) component